MPRITLKETITKEIEIPMDSHQLIDSLTEEERTNLLERLNKKTIELKVFRLERISLNPF